MKILMTLTPDVAGIAVCVCLVGCFGGVGVCVSHFLLSAVSPSKTSSKNIFLA